MIRTPLLYDLTATQPSFGSTRHGGGKYGEIVLKRIIERKLPVVCYFNKNNYLNPEIKDFLSEHKVRLYDVNFQNLENIIIDCKAKVLYSPLPTTTLMKRKDIIVIGTIHGLRRLETPPDNYCFKYRNLNWKDWLFYFSNKFAPNLLRKKLSSFYLKSWNSPNFRMVTVSHHTSNAIKVYFPELRDKNIPVYYSPSTTEYEITERKYLDKYFLMVSGNRLEKNNLRAIIALDRLFSDGFLDGFTARITGSKDSMNFRYKIKNHDRFLFLGYVDDKELDQLYHDAYCLIYPSVNEGFGYPPLEAMHYATPVISSSYCSIPEVCGDANLYFNPFSIEEIENRLLQISKPECHEIKSREAYNRYKYITNKQKFELDQLINYIYSKNK